MFLLFTKFEFVHETGWLINVSQLTSKVKQILTSLPIFDLFTLTFHEYSNCGRENYWKSWVWIPAPKGQNIFVPFIFSFSNSSHKTGYFDPNHFLIPCFVIHHFSWFVDPLGVRTSIAYCLGSTKSRKLEEQCAC